MIYTISYFILIVYGLIMALIFLYSLMQLQLLKGSLRTRKKELTNTNVSKKIDVNTLPKVTVQLPIYNEQYVIERLLESITKLDYPKNLLEIQVLDDSTDESKNLIAKKVTELQQKGIDITHMHRSLRTGFKAGALKEGLTKAKGEFIAIFDADFTPNPNWLHATLCGFTEHSVGLVQTRWGHLNRDFSLLTKIQALALDFHFHLEQGGRNALKHFMSFNGTAGIWRKSCILDAGNWQADTLTEDLDLSYRAQLKGWKFKYLDHIETPAELPIFMDAVKNQQFRWNKGAAENFKKLATQLIKNPKTPLKTKVFGIFHLFNSSVFLLVFLASLLSLPMLIIKNIYPEFMGIFNIFSFLAISMLIFFICYWVIFKRVYGGGFANFIKYIQLFFSFFSISMGFSLINSIGVLEGHLGKKSPFVRTPKIKIEGKYFSKKNSKYNSKKVHWSTYLEGVMIIYFLVALYLDVVYKDLGLLCYHFMLLSGFSYVFLKTIAFNKP